MPQTKEQKAIRIKAFYQSPIGKKRSRIANWKRRGIIVNDYDKFYEAFLSTTNCKICKKELTIDKYHTHSTRCVDHDHLINDKPNVRAICCHACNCNNTLANTSGEPNINYRKDNNCWSFSKRNGDKTHRKSGFKTKEEAINYKKDFLASPIFG